MASTTERSSSTTEISAAFIVPDYKDVVAFVILLAMLAVRPTGLLGART